MLLTPLHLNVRISVYFSDAKPPNFFFLLLNCFFMRELKINFLLVVFRENNLKFRQAHAVTHNELTSGLTEDLLPHFDG